MFLWIISFMLILLWGLFISSLAGPYPSALPLSSGPGHSSFNLLTFDSMLSYDWPAFAVWSISFVLAVAVFIFPCRLLSFKSFDCSTPWPSTLDSLPLTPFEFWVLEDLRANYVKLCCNLDNFIVRFDQKNLRRKVIKERLKQKSSSHADKNIMTGTFSVKSRTCKFRSH